MRFLPLLMTATFFVTPALAVDEFGQRFGNNTPYALENDIGNALRDTSGFDLDDLNDIAPASGDEEPYKAIEEESLSEEDGENQDNDDQDTDDIESDNIESDDSGTDESDEIDEDEAEERAE